MAILLPVISCTVDEIILDYLKQNQSGDQLSTNNSSELFDSNQNNSNTVDNNNNKKVDLDDISPEVLNWADEPWTPREDVDVPEWAKLEGPCFDVVDETKHNCGDLIWAEDPWTQAPLVDIPAWMKLPGIDYDIPEASIVDITDSNQPQDDDREFLAMEVKIGNWADEPYSQTPLDVPSWAQLPGIDYPTRRARSNILYWEYNLDNYRRIRTRFGRKVFNRKLSSFREEQLVYNNQGEPMLYVPARLIRPPFYYYEPHHQL